ncbi:MAG: hypothetical protein ACI88H_002557 [Cocleimonas sp.]|jgi:hypothetical protein
MPSIENNNSDWKEMRARIDSIANAMFLIGGGALSISITVILSNLKKLNISESNVHLIECAWGQLALSLMLVLLLKIHVVFQEFLLQVATNFMIKHYMKFNWSVLIIGLSAFYLFCNGFYFMVLSASNIVSST